MLDLALAFVLEDVVELVEEEEEDDDVDDECAD